MASCDPGPSSDPLRLSTAYTQNESFADAKRVSLGTTTSATGSNASTCKCTGKSTSRNLVVCIDGTSNKFGQNNTNIVKLFASIDLEDEKQLAYYSSGIGTGPKTLHFWSRLERVVSDKFDMAIAWNMEEIVVDAYGWLARTYKEGDRIFLFGFSRGAYQVRVLAGMIHEVGLIRTPTEKQIGTAYDHYEAIRSGKPKTREIAREFKKTFSWKNLRVHFVGVWDTVSSVGLIRGDVFLSTSSSAAHACHFRHALALDERRVKFMPEYFHEVNVGVHEKNDQPDIKEVWFAGSHSDVGGKSRPGKAFQAGNVSLLWMREEAVAKGLALKPTDMVWIPDDLDLGTSNSMSTPWKVVEWFPIRHQVSYTGAGGSARRFHRSQPRRVIPGQKIHASVLFANTYRPSATFGEGFEILTGHKRFSTEGLSSEIWETHLFDHTAAKELLKLTEERPLPAHLDRLLFMVRSEEGREAVTKVYDWEGKLKRLMQNSDNIVKLTAAVAYLEISQTIPDEVPQNLLQDAKNYFEDILKEHKHRDCVRAIALLPPIANHEILRSQILTTDVIDRFMDVLDIKLENPDDSFGCAMEALGCLVRCDDTLRTGLISKLSTSKESSSRSRISLMLKLEDASYLTASLRVIVLLAQKDPESIRNCNISKKLRKLAKRRDGLIGLLAVDALLALWNPANTREGQLATVLADPRIRANIAGVLNRRTIVKDASEASDRALRHLFGLGEAGLQGSHQRLIGELVSSVKKRDARERTAATMTLLVLAKDDNIRKFLRDQEVIKVFVDQLQYKHSALLSAYALSVLMGYVDICQHMVGHGSTECSTAKHIVNMLRLNYFDDAVGEHDGFQIFRDLIKHDDLRKHITEQGITQVLLQKLKSGGSNEIRTSLICLDIFKGYSSHDCGTDQLAERGMSLLQEDEWKMQKAGVTILSALARTDSGVESLRKHISPIICMLLNDKYMPETASITRRATPGAATPLPETSLSPPANVLPSSRSPVPSSFIDASNDNSVRPSTLLGPACALRALSTLETLRKEIRENQHYGKLKDRWLSNGFTEGPETSPWKVHSPTKADVLGMIENMILSVEEGGFSQEGVASVGDLALPHIQHWDRLIVDIVGKGAGTVGALGSLPILLGISAVTAAAAIVLLPLLVPVYAYELTQKFAWVQRRKTRHAMADIMEE